MKCPFFTKNEDDITVKAAAEFTANVTAEFTARAKSLEMLYDYTKFHIGLYLTLTAFYVTVVTIKGKDVLGKETLLFDTNRYLAGAAIVLFVVAGMAGGVVASNVILQIGGSSRDFLDKKIGPWRSELIRAQIWVYIEHASFWVGLASALLSFL